jgi:tRNA nucleotidyltransferase (CCA-adding enzyme)
LATKKRALKVLRALEAEGWMKVLFPAWTSAKADEEKLTALHDLAVELLAQGVHADMSAAQMQLLTAGLAGKDGRAEEDDAASGASSRSGTVWTALAAGFAKALLAKENSAPSAGYKLFTSYDPEAILWLGFTSIDPQVKERFNLFLKVWPEARQRIPHALLQEMRITPELAAYREIVRGGFSGTDRRPVDHAGGVSRLPGAAFASRSAAQGNHQEAARQAGRRGQAQGALLRRGRL